MPFRRYLKRDFMMFCRQWFGELCEILLVYSERQNVGERRAPAQTFRENRSVFFVQLCPRLDLSHNQAHYGAVIDGSKAVEPRRVRRNVLVPTIARVNVISIESWLFAQFTFSPWHRIFDGERIFTEQPHFVDVVGREKPKLEPFQAALARATFRSFLDYSLQFTIFSLLAVPAIEWQHFEWIHRAQSFTIAYQIILKAAREQF